MTLTNRRAEPPPEGGQTDASDRSETGEALVVFTPSGRRGRFPRGSTVLEAARSLGVDIDSVCGGRSICGRCQVEIGEGRFAKHGIDSRAFHVTEATPGEARYADKRGLAAGRRLSCQSRIQGDLVIDVPPESQVHKQVIRKRAEVRAIEVDPEVKLHYVEVAEPDLHDPSGDLRRLEDALRQQWEIGDLSCDLRVLQTVQKALRDGDWKVTVAVREGERLLTVWPGFHDRIYGIAFDIGSTTIAAHLCDLETGEVLAAGGRMNPQIRFGEDLMSRVSYIMMNPGGEAALTAAVREALNALAGEVAAEAGIDLNNILEVTIVGNPIMHHLVLGIDPTELGGAPFALATDQALNIWASEIDLRINPDGRAYVLPCIAGHVGADTAAVILSETPYLSDELRLVVDVGTNAEIVLGNRQRLLACSSPTGPAFEGAQISCGQRAAPGAIERVRIDPETLEPRFRIIGGDLWSDEPGFYDMAVRTGVTGICGSGIIEVLAEMYLAGILTADGVIDGSLAARSPRIVPDGRTFSYVLQYADGLSTEKRITQTDVRAVQLAKAALYAGIRLLMDRMGVESVDRITLAGAFGSHIDVKYAMVLGLIPDCDLAKVGSAGNAAGTGARIALVNRSSRAEIERVVRQVEKVETAVEPKFQDHFVRAMAIPHKSDPFPNLRAAVTLPEPREAAGPEEGRRRRRRG
ncbi:ASKHA domain-containing protein [Inquilinus sp. CAU 1745]|uniref:ASKHA domain-containing protein n=1 Tax=Inquilinus sp. CAU 1745 TaxID=3140369 RepID=UPI00325A8BCC